ncbi:hypothetical protein [Tolypothrix sp. VBCCA 56010]|uniref:hypothetical protein n=1 Tax=Tolypothrix sp. VBCCA 56010 TaxID=3137731 RepID=UPI003D7DA2D3
MLLQENRNRIKAVELAAADVGDIPPTLSRSLHALVLQWLALGNPEAASIVHSNQNSPLKCQFCFFFGSWTQNLNGYGTNAMRSPKQCHHLSTILKNVEIAACRKFACQKKSKNYALLKRRYSQPFNQQSSPFK